MTAGIAAVLMAVPAAVLASPAGPYDDPKALALPVLAALTGLGWLVARPGRAPAAAESARSVRVLVWVAAALIAWSIAATAASIAPGLSLVGSFGRGMGLFTIASGPLLFFIVRSQCRGPAATRIVVDAALLGSVPVCALALGQALGWDPLPRSWDPAVAELRVRSTLGQHIFLGSYLVILVPLAVARMVSAARHRRASAADGRHPAEPSRSVGVGAAWVIGVLVLAGLASRWPAAWWALVPWSVLGALAWARVRARAGEGGPVGRAVWLFGGLSAAQVLVVILCAARGPLLGMLLGLSVVGVAVLVRRRAWRTLAGAGVAVGLLAAALALVSMAGSPLAGLARAGVLGRLSQLTDASPGTPVRFRLDVWSGILAGWGRQSRGDEIVPGTSPWLRSAIGFGPETQLLALERLTAPAVSGLEAQGTGWSAQYLVDRAHNAVLDQLVTEGIVGAGLWLALMWAVIAAGIGRLRRAETDDERGLRLGCLGAVLAHLAEAQVGIVTAMPLALFWIAAALLTSAPWSGDPSPAPVPAARRSRAWQVGLVAGVLVTGAAAWIDARWLLASIAYADGARRHMAGRTAEAYAAFARSSALMPWIPMTSEAQASTALRLAGSEVDAGRRLELLRQGEGALAEARRFAPPGGSAWALSAQLAFAKVRAGDRASLRPSLDAFETAARIRPRDPQILAQLGLAWFEAKDPVRARQAAEQALRLPGGRGQWLAWAVLSASQRDLGNLEAARLAAQRARRVAPPEARHLLDALP